MRQAHSGERVGSLAGLRYPDHEIAWPDDGVTRVPYFVYEDADRYRLELEQMFRGPVWNYLGLEIEIPSPSAPVPKAARLSIVAVVTSTRSSRRAARCCSASAP